MGPADSTVWRDSYITAISRRRAAGYTGTLSITSGGCGQDPADLINYAQAVFDSDPQRNVIFDMHVYGTFADPATVSWQSDLAGSFASLQTLGLPIVIGEFGPGRDIGPSPTMIPPDSIITLAESSGFGWMPWAWDDTDGSADDNWFALVYSPSAGYTSSASLTIYGQDVIENPTFGVKVLATPANF